MKDWKWPAVAALTVVVAAIVVMFGLTNDQTTRNHLVGYFDSIVPFVVGAAAGATVGGAVGFAKGKGVL
jgi:hypothetical protein